MLWRHRLTRRRALQRGAALAALGCAQPALFTRGGPAAASPRQEVDPPGWEAVSARLQAAVDGGEVDGAGLVAVSAAQTLYLRAFGRYGVDSVDLIASATKQPSACTLMALVDDGAVALDDPVSRYLPEFGGAKAAITLRQCLSHTSGLPAMAPELADDTITLAEAVRRYARLPLVAAPGTRFVYGGVSYAVAGRMAEVASGMSWAALFAQRIAGPLGMATFDYGATPNPRIGGGAACSLLDYAPFLQLHLNGGASGGAQVLSAGAVAEMQRPQLPPGVTTNGVAGKREFGYGLGWWFDALDAAGNPVQFSDPGLFGAIPWLDPGRGYGAFLLVRRLLRDSVRLYDDLLPLVQAAVAAG